MKKYNDEELTLDFKKYSQLSYKDSGEEYVQLFFDNKNVGLVEVSTDVENENREYIIINCEIIYLDTIEKYKGPYKLASVELTGLEHL